MENGVEALKIASSVLIFVIAITITISAFTVASQTLNRVFSAKDEDKYVTITDEHGVEQYLNFVYFNGGTRNVGIETIVPSIYRAYKENYSIYFFKNDGTKLELYTNNKGNNVNYIDLEKEVHASSEAAIESVKNLLYSNKCLLNPNGFYEYLKEKTFTEKLGEYYMNDLNGGTEIAEVNKVKKRVIVYIEN